MAHANIVLAAKYNAMTSNGLLADHKRRRQISDI